MVSATLVSFKLLAGKPMECWVPAEYQKGWEDYAGEQRCLNFGKFAEMYCWAKNTYFVPWHESIPLDAKDRGRTEVGGHARNLRLHLYSGEAVDKSLNVVSLRWLTTNGHRSFYSSAHFSSIFRA